MKFKPPIVMGCVACLLAVLVAGCPPQKSPPFDATGNYEGSWDGTVSTDEKVTLNIEDCPIALELGQAVDVLLLNYHVVGLLTVNWGCLLPPEVIALLGLQPEDVTLPLLAVMNDAGEMTLSVTIDTTTISPTLLALLGIESGTVQVPLQNLTFELDAAGVDGDDDGHMDSAAGTLSLNASFDDNGTQKSVSIGGTFMVALSV